MHCTIFNTPIVKDILRGILVFLFKILSWKKIGQLPDISKYVIILAPHTSNWDLLYGICTAFALKLDVCFMAKKELFRWPFGPFIKFLGGVPIDRDKSINVVDQIIQRYNENEKYIIAITPEGTRSKTKYWKTGFYHIATGADVPILLGFLDYTAKKSGVGPLITPTGDIEHDMHIIRDFYSKITGKYSEKAAPISVSQENKEKIDS